MTLTKIAAYQRADHTIWFFKVRFGIFETHEPFSVITGPNDDEAHARDLAEQAAIREIALWHLYFK